MIFRGGDGVLRNLSKFHWIVFFLISIQLVQAKELPDRSPEPAAEFEKAAENLLEKPLDLEQADPFGMIGTRFEIWNDGKKTQTFDFQHLYGELSDHLTLVVGKNPSDLRVEIIQNPETKKNEAHLIYQRDGFVFKKWAGSRMIIGGQTHDFVRVVEDQNMILLLDRSGRIYMIDRVNLRRLFGQYACPLWNIGAIHLEPDSEYQLHIKEGRLSETGLKATLDPKLASDLQQLEHRTIKDGSLFITRKRPGETHPTIIDYFGRDHILHTAYASQARLLAIMEDYHAFSENQRRQMDGITLELAQYLDGELANHPEIFKNAERSEIQKTLLSMDPGNTLRGLQSLRIQAEQTKENFKHSLLEWLAENSPDKVDVEIEKAQVEKSESEKSAYRKFRASSAYQRLGELTKKFMSPASLLILSLIGFTAAGGVVKDFALRPETSQAFKSLILSLESFFPIPFHDTYRPLIVKALSLQYTFAATILLGFGVAATLMKKSLDHATLIGVRLAGALTLSPLYYIYKILGQKNAIFAARNSQWPSVNNGGFHQPYSEEKAENARRILVTKVQETQRRRALARLLAFAAVSEEEGISFHGLSWLEIRLARLKKTQAASSEASAEAHRDFEAALKTMDPVEIANAEYELKDTAARVALDFSDKDEEVAEEMKALSLSMDQFLNETRTQGTTELPTSSEMDFYRSRAKEILAQSKESSRARRILNDGLLAFNATLKYELPYHINLFGLDVFRENLLRAQPSAVVGGQILSQWWADTLATQFVLEAFWTGWPLAYTYESIKNPTVYSGQGPPTPAANPELFSADGKLNYNFFGSRADFRQPSELFAQAQDFAFTHNGQNVSMWDNHLGYLISLQARALYELGAASEVENPYAMEVPETPKNEQSESFGKSLLKWIKIIAQPRAAGYRGYFINKRDNVFRFFPLHSLLMSATRKIFLTGASIANIPFMVYFFQSVNMWAWSWPWAPIQLGITRVGEENARIYSKFSMIREKFSESLKRDHPEDARKYAAQLIDIYREQNISLPSLEQLKSKGMNEWSSDDLLNAEKEVHQIPAIKKEINPKLQEGLNMLGGYITTGLAIPFLMFAIRTDMNWPLFGTVAGSLALLGYPVVDRIFKWQARWAERKWDPQMRKKEALRRRDQLLRNYAFEGSRILAQTGSLDLEKASPEQASRIRRYREQLDRFERAGTCQLQISKIMTGGEKRE